MKLLFVADDAHKKCASSWRDEGLKINHGRRGLGWWSSHFHKACHNSCWILMLYIGFDWCENRSTCVRKGAVCSVDVRRSHQSAWDGGWACDDEMG